MQSETIRSNYQTEYWLSASEISSVEYSAYWNDEGEETDKFGQIFDGDFNKLEQHLAQIGVVEQLKQCLDFLETKFRWKPRGVGADLASGNLWAPPFLLRAGPIEKIYCVEYSKHRLLRIGPRVLEHYGVPSDKAVLCLGSFYQLNLADNSLDFVLLSEAFHHAERPLELLAEISRVLRADGAVIIIGEYELTRLDTIKHFGKFLISRLVPSSVQRRVLKRTLSVQAPFPQGQILIDPVLGDHWYSEESYREMFSAAGFASYKVETDVSQLQAFVLLPDGQKPVSCQ
jgi:ubiquinone/menaquinone biosynthesis C-methylase UbiE